MFNVSFLVEHHNALGYLIIIRMYLSSFAKFLKILGIIKVVLDIQKA